MLLLLPQGFLLLDHGSRSGRSSRLLGLVVGGLDLAPLLGFCVDCGLSLSLGLPRLLLFLSALGFFMVTPDCRERLKAREGLLISTRTEVMYSFIAAS